MQKLFRFRNRMLVVKYYKLDENVTGIKNKTKDGFVLFLDLDDVNERWLESRLRKLIDHFKLSTCYILKSSEHCFHVICLDIFSFDEILQMMAWFDKELLKHYMIFMIRRGYALLRTSAKYGKGKPVYYGSMPSPWCERKQSYAHYLVLKEYYGADLKIRNSNRYDVIETDTYPTCKN